jgi:putative transcriptional regulator
MLPSFGGTGTLGAMVRLRIGKLLRERGMTAYGLAKGAKLSTTVAYRLAGEGGRVRRLDTRTIDKLCRVLNCQPGDLFEYQPHGRR